MFVTAFRSLGADPILRRLAGPGALAFGIKIASAALSYVMFIALARSMTLADYGIFGFGFSWAILLSQLAAAGQPSLVLRLLPEQAGDVKNPYHVGILRFAHLTALVGVMGTLLLWLCVGSFDDSMSSLYLLAVGAVMATTVLSDLETGVQRAEGSVLLALAPREILWRIVVILLCLPSILGWVDPQSPGFAMASMSAALLLIVILQMCLHPATRTWLKLGQDARIETAGWLRMSYWFCLAATVTAAAPALAVILLGWVTSPEETGPFFAAVKTSQMLMLILIAGNIVAGPLFVQHFQRAETASVQRIAGLIALASTVFSALGSLGLLLAGSVVMGLFGAGFEAAMPSLMILAFGTTLRAIFGPGSQVLSMGGEERFASKVTLLSNGLSVATMPGLAWAFGAEGAAIAIVIGLVAGAVWSNRACKELLEVDASVFGLRRKGAAA